MFINRKHTDLLVNLGMFQNVTCFTTDPCIPLTKYEFQMNSHTNAFYVMRFLNLTTTLNCIPARRSSTTRGWPWRGGASRRPSRRGPTAAGRAAICWRPPSPWGLGRGRASGGNCIKIGLPGKPILGKRKGLWEVIFS